MQSTQDSSATVLSVDTLGSEKSRFSKNGAGNVFSQGTRLTARGPMTDTCRKGLRYFQEVLKKKGEKKNHLGIRFGTAESCSLYMKTSEQEWGRGASSSRGKYYTPNTEHSQSEATDGERKLCKSSVTVGAEEINQPEMLGGAASGEWLNTREENTILLLNTVISYFRLKKKGWEKDECNVISKSHQQVS